VNVMEDLTALIKIPDKTKITLKNLTKLNSVLFPIVGLLILLACLTFIFSVILRTEAELDCGSGNDWQVFNRSCFLIIENQTSVTECRKHCMENGGDLSSVHSKEENQFIVDILGSEPNPTWIGGSVVEVEGDFFWLDGSAWDFENWDEGEPDRKKFGKTSHECVFLGNNLSDRGRWWDGVCEWTRWRHDCLCRRFS